MIKMENKENFQDMYIFNDLNKMNVAQIKDILRRKKLPLVGKKDDLVDRLWSVTVDGLFPDQNDNETDAGGSDEITISTVTPNKKRKVPVKEELLNKEEYYVQEINDLSKHKLKDILKSHNLPSYGNKDSLIDRVLKYMPTKVPQGTQSISKSNFLEDPINKESFTRDDLKDLMVSDLKEILKKHNLIVTGKKEDLIERILSDVTNDDNATDDMDVSTTVGTTIKTVSNDKKEKHVYKLDENILNQENFTNDELEKFNKDALKQILASKGFTTTGTKEQLIERIMKFIPLNEYEDVKDITYSRDSGELKFTIALAYHNTKCIRCEQTIDQGRTIIFFNERNKKSGRYLKRRYHIECFCRYRPISISRFEDVRWENTSEKDIAKFKTLFNKYL